MATKNLFEGAKWGDRYECRNGMQAVFINDSYGMVTLLINLDAINNAPANIREHIKAKYGCFFVINAMSIDYMRDKLNMTFDL